MGTRTECEARRTSGVAEAGTGNESNAAEGVRFSLPSRTLGELCLPYFSFLANSSPYSSRLELAETYFETPAKDRAQSRDWPRLLAFRFAGRLSARVSDRISLKRAAAGVSSLPPS